MESSSHRLAVGVRDTTLGWVEIRTHAAAGQVSAVLATSSSATHSALSAQLPAMREYLAGQHVHVDTLTSERYASAAGGDSSHGQAGNRESSDAETPRPSIVSQQFSEEAEAESLSCISVRV